jgi:hypothetical protein
MSSPSSKSKPKRGSQCSVEGGKYEKVIHSVIKNTTLNGKPFTTQKEEDLGGSTSKNDIICNSNAPRGCFRNTVVGIEAKKANTPDWMQSKLEYSVKFKSWRGSNNSKIPKTCRKIFNNLLEGMDIYNREIPPFVVERITHEEWLNIKLSTKKWNDVRIPIPADTIKKLYRAKGCYYIQIDGYGLFHLGEDICNFGVPEFIIDQQIRIRTKVHSRKTANGFASLSVMAACQPKNIKQLVKSPYSLDDINLLPSNLKYVPPNSENGPVLEVEEIVEEAVEQVVEEVSTTPIHKSSPKNKVVCECGATIAKYGLKRHQQTDKHKRLLSLV